MNQFIYLLIGLGLVFLNAFFVAAEFAMVKLRNTRMPLISKENPWRGSILTKIHAQLDAYLSACQLGITLASLGLGWVGEPAFAHLLTPVFNLFHLDPETMQWISVATAFILISFLHIVLGELLPKSLAIRQSESVSLWTAIPLYAFYWLMYPAIWFLNACTNFLLNLFKLNTYHEGEQRHSSEEIKIILRSSEIHGELSNQESKILTQTLELSDLSAEDIMRSYDDLITLPPLLAKTELLEKLNHYRFSRYPIMDDNQQAMGLLHVKDLQTHLHEYQDEQLLDLTKLSRPIPKISPREPVLQLLNQFQKGLPHFALVVGRQDAIIGFITLDNLLHLVLGGIKDEFHKTQEVWETHSDGSFTVKGNCPLYALERALNQDLSLSEEEEEEVATVAGLILFKLGDLPKIGERIVFDEFVANIEEMQGIRITKVRIYPIMSNKE